VHFSFFKNFSDFHIQTSYKILLNLVMKCLHFEAEVPVNEKVPECTLHFFSISQTFSLKLECKV